MPASYSFLTHENVLRQILGYRKNLINKGIRIAGKHFQKNLNDYLQEHSLTHLQDIPVNEFIQLLMQTKLPTIFAESQVYHDQRDWTQKEGAILGGISVNMEVTMYNNGGHDDTFTNHKNPISGVLAYVCGALLATNHGRPADEDRVTKNGKIDPDSFNELCEERLLPELLMLNQQAGNQHKKLAITLPGIGTSLFAGNYGGKDGKEIKAFFLQALQHIIKKHATKLPHLDVVHYDPYKGNQDSFEQIEHIQFRVKPLCNKEGPTRTSQLEYPEGTSEETHLLASFVAWDHFSYPGNDFLKGLRKTDDGVKGASTDTPYRITEIEGHYDEKTGSYLPPEPYSTWKQCILDKKIKLQAPVIVATRDGTLEPLEDILARIENEEYLEEVEEPIPDELQQFLQILDDYKTQRDKIKSEHKHYLFCIGLGFRKTDKFEAVEALKVALTTGDAEGLSTHLAALRDRDLGHTIRGFLKTHDTASFLGINVTTVSDLVETLAKSTKPTP